MNDEALVSLFNQEMECDWDNLSEIDEYPGTGYMLYTNTLSNEFLREISACGGSIESFPAEWFRVYDE